MAGFSFDFSSSSLEGGLNQLEAKALATTKMYASTQALELQAYMKQNRPWTDRTGLAKAMLSATVSQPSTHVVRVTLAHGVDYGIDLELKNNGNYAIVRPTLATQGPKVMNGFNGMLSTMLEG